MSIQEFGPDDQGYAAMDEVANIANVKDPAAWVRRRKLETRTRMHDGRRLTLVALPDVMSAAKGLPVDSPYLMSAPFRTDEGWSPINPDTAR